MTVLVYVGPESKYEADLARDIRPYQGGWHLVKTTQSQEMRRPLTTPPSAHFYKYQRRKAK